MPARFENRPPRAGRNRVTEPGEFALDPPVTPGGVLRDQPQNQPAQGGCRAAACGAAAGLGPALRDQIPVPPQDRGWRDDPMQLAGRGQ